MELKDYWLTIRRRWVLVLLAFVTVLGAAALGVFAALCLSGTTALEIGINPVLALMLFVTVNDLGNFGLWKNLAGLIG